MADMDRLINRALGDVSGGASGNHGASQAPILDRCRSQLRLPIYAIADALLVAHVQSIPDVALQSLSEPPAEKTIKHLQDSGVMDRSTLDPVAFELLNVVNQASLIVAVDLTYGEERATSTVWATPRRAVVSTSLDPSYIEFRSVPVTQLPQVLAELIVLRSPRFVGDEPFTVSEQSLNQADKAGDDRDRAISLLTDGGLQPDLAVLALDLRRPDVRRWQITSTWSTDDGSETTKLKGLDAGPSGQWLITGQGTQAPDSEADIGSEPGQLTFEPQGHGEIVSAFRGVLPRNWLGTPLNPPTDVGL